MKHIITMLLLTLALNGCTTSINGLDVENTLDVCGVPVYQVKGGGFYLEIRDVVQNSLSNVDVVDEDYILLGAGHEYSVKGDKDCKIAMTDKPIAHQY